MKRKGTNLLNDHVLSFFQRSPLKKFNFRQVLNLLPYEVNKNNIKECLCLLEEKKQIKQTKPGSYMLFLNRKPFIGVLDKTSGGSGYIIRKNIEKDVFVSEKKRQPLQRQHHYANDT